LEQVEEEGDETVSLEVVVLWMVVLSQVVWRRGEKQGDRGNGDNSRSLVNKGWRNRRMNLSG
jgi:hypothetical protein